MLTDSKRAASLLFSTGPFSYVFHTFFRLRRPFSPFHTFVLTLDATFDHRRTFFLPRRFRARCREPHGHLIIFLHQENTTVLGAPWGSFLLS